MSQENVERAKAGLAALAETYATGDMSPWARNVRQEFSPEVVLDTEGAAFTEGEWRGHDGVIQFVANQMEVLDGMWIRSDEFIDVNDNCLIVVIAFGGRARHTGIDVELTPSHVLDFLDGRVIRWRVFQGRDEALEAAGLSE